MKNITASSTAYLLLRVDLALTKDPCDTFFKKGHRYQTNCKTLEKDMKACCFRSSMYVHRHTHTCVHLSLSGVALLGVGGILLLPSVPGYGNYKVWATSIQAVGQ